MKSSPIINHFRTVLAALVAALIFSPLFSSAQTLSGGVKTVAGLVNDITGTLVSALGQLALASGVVIFLYGVVQYIWGQREGDASKTKIGSSYMGWGLLALFVMFSVYGIIQFAQKILFPEGSGIKVNEITIPQFNLLNGGAPSAANPSLTPGDRYICTPFSECKPKAGGSGECSYDGYSCNPKSSAQPSTAPAAGAQRSSSAGVSGVPSSGQTGSISAPFSALGTSGNTTGSGGCRTGFTYSPEERTCVSLSTGAPQSTAQPSSGTSAADECATYGNNCPTTSAPAPSSGTSNSSGAGYGESCIDVACQSQYVCSPKDNYICLSPQDVQ